MVQEAADNTPVETTPSVSHRTSFFDALAESRMAKSLAFFAATSIGAGSLSFLSGCSMKEEAQVQAKLEKEIKFSTIDKNAKVSLEKMPSYFESRTELANAIEPARTATAKIVAAIEDNVVMSTETRSAIENDLNALKKIIDKDLQDPTFSGNKPLLGQLERTLSSTIAELNNVGEGMTRGSDSPLLAAVRNLQGELQDWKDALTRDIDMITVGVHGKKIAELAGHLESTVEHLKVLPEDTVNADWIAKHAEEVTVVRALLALDIKHLEEWKNDSRFASIVTDVAQAQKLLKDLDHALDPQNGFKLFQIEPGQRNSAGQALLKEAVKMAQAFRTDLEQELVQTLGVEKVQPVAEAQPGQQNGVVHHHHYHNSGSNFLMWHYLMNNNSGYYGGYTYTPRVTPYSYSGAGRFHSSPEYHSYAAASHDAHGVVSGKPGVSSHTGSKTSVSTSHSDSHSSVSHSSSSRAPVGGGHSGFSGGKSYGSGFGG